MRRALAPALTLLALLLGLALAPAAGAATSTARVIGGSTATSTDAPWQALVLPSGYLCGGSILDATHVVTAAHCVYDEDDQSIISAGAITIRAGILDRTPNSGGQARAVSAIAVFPGYDPDAETGDAAILTLATPLTTGPTVQPIALTDVGWRPTVGVTDMQLSGWGSTVARDPDDPPVNLTASTLLKVAKTIHATDACPSVYGPAFDTAMLLCAGQAGLDACQGDSGGPLAVQDNGVWKLAGIVTGGAGCGWSGFPGFYARVAHAGLHDFLAHPAAAAPIQAPAFTRAPTLSGAAQPGTNLTCDPGEATNAYEYDTAFAVGGNVVAYGTVLPVGTRDVGTTFTCVSTAYGLIGTAEATSAPVTVHAVPAPAPAPAPKPAPSPYAPAPDVAAPVAKVLRSSCARRVCTLEVRVEDPAPSAGVKGLDAKVDSPYRTTCRVKVGRKVKRKACTKIASKRLTPAPGTAINTYKIVTSRLRKGTHTFTLIASDTAGHRQVKPTTVKKKTR